MHTYYYAVTNESKKEIIGMYSSEAKSVEDFEVEYNTVHRRTLREGDAIKQCYNLTECVDFCDKVAGVKTRKDAWDWRASK